MVSPELVEAEVRVTGRVQGVGFRPFIYRLAVRHGLRGYVINLGDAGVEVVVEGATREVEGLINAIKSEAPSVSEVGGVLASYRPYRGRFEEFVIDKSRNGGKAASGIFPPDIGICPDCLMDMEDESGRWFEYPFTACAWCGPRFTGVKSLPYDRERTHMHNFPMCTDCTTDYKNPLDRRFDAQGITCSHCGPKMSLLDAGGKAIVVQDVFVEAAKLLREGHVLAVKGIGGFHIAALATEDEPVNKLRARKNRPYQPFALMSPDMDDVKTFTEPDAAESRALVSWQKPIVLVRKNGEVISEQVAPGLSRVGVMLPYTGIQVMLFKRLRAPALIMTSGNRSGLPMATTNEAALSELRGIVDYFLVHDREIVNRCDDSLLRMNGGRVAFIRRSRGYVPDPVEIPLKKGISFAVGTEQSNVAAVTLDGRCYQTQYLGDITNLESFDYEKTAIYAMRDLLKITRNPDVIACDQHPGYMTSQLAEVISQETGARITKSQHHHAHIVSVCAENGIKPDEEVVGIALDGAGYGSDGSIWGGEVLISTYFDYKRAGHLQNLPMPGGDICAYSPYRMLISALTLTMSDEEIRDITKNHIQKALINGQDEFWVVTQQAREKNVIKTSSSGRLLDSVASLIGSTYRRTYEGELTMRLESLAELGDPNKIKFKPEIIQDGGIYQLKTENMLNYLTINQNKFKTQDIAAFSQKYLANGIANTALNVAQEQDVHSVALSGGVAVNQYISNTIIKSLEKQGLKVFTNQKTAPGDGGSSLGQSCIALVSVI
ncbi:TPA: carbamoyltransferase HypF [Candidatus Bathyarchaeota archaeon]|nr:carbamoyltransferase HypF [Candidatus Bathyarchaeota archaeon]